MTSRFKNKHLTVTRRGRAAYVSWEWYNNKHSGRPSGPYFLMFGISNPRMHKWWATRIHWYLPDWVGHTPLARIPSTGYRSLGDSWSPMRPWKGGGRTWGKRIARDA